jgi:hypothetical protein
MQAQESLKLAVEWLLKGVVVGIHSAPFSDGGADD